MISSIPMTEMPSGKIIQIHVDDETLFKIAEEVSKNEQAMAALKEGKRRDKEAKARGDISSPEPPDDYLIIYQIMNKFDERYAGTVGHRIINFLEAELMTDEVNPNG